MTYHSFQRNADLCHFFKHAWLDNAVLSTNLVLQSTVTVKNNQQTVYKRIP
jgi:hypothetical protein